MFNFNFGHQVVFVRDKIIDKLPEYISEPRLRHTLGVEKTAVNLAGLYGADPEKVRLAALLHDIARDMKADELVRLVVNGSYNLDEKVYSNPVLLHAPAGAEIAKRDFKIEDPEILEAIRYHTTGRENMSIVSSIVFIADYIEPGRKFRGVKTARRLARKSIEKTLLYIYKSLIRHLVSNERYICIETIKAYNTLV